MQPDFGGMTIAPSGTVEEEERVQETPTPVVEETPDFGGETPAPNFGGETPVPKVQEAKGGGIVSDTVDFMLTPKNENSKTEAYQQGVKDVTNPPINAPKQEEQKPLSVVPSPLDAIVSAYDAVFSTEDGTEGKLVERNWFAKEFTGETFGAEQVKGYMQHYLKKGMKKNEIIKKLKAEGASPLDLSNAFYSTMSTKGPSAAVTQVTQDGMKRGLARTGLAIAKTSASIANTVGVDTTEVDKKLNYAEGQIKAEHDQVEDTYGMQSPIETAIKYAPEVLSMGISGTKKGVMATEAIVEFGLSKADGFSNGQSLARAATISIIAGGAQWATEGPSIRNENGLSEEAQNLVDYMGIKKGSKEYDTIKESIKDVDLDDQVRIIAEQSGNKSAGAIDQAMKHMDDTDRIAYAERLAKTRQDFAEATGLDDIVGIEKATREEYSLMRDALRYMGGGKEYDVSTVIPRLQEIAPLVRNDFGVSKIDNIVENMQIKSTKSLDELMDIRQELNAEYGKASSDTAKKAIEEVKASLDNYFKNSGISPKMMATIDDSINSYSRMKSQKELNELFEKNTRTFSEGSDVGEVKVTNWGSLLADAKEAKLGKNVEDEIQLLERLSKKYGSSQTDRVGGVKTKGSADVAQTLSSSLTGAAKVLWIRNLIDYLAASFPNQTGKNRAFQRAIANSMKKNKSYEEFATDLIKDKNTPLTIKARIQQHLEGIEDEVAESVANPAPTRKSQDLGDKATQAQQKALKGIDANLNRQQTNLTKEVRNRFQTKKVTADDRLELARITDRITTARNAGDRTAVKEATSELSAFTEHTKNLPSRETSTEEAARIVIEKETARVKRVEQARVNRIRREAEAAARAEQQEAEQALREEASRANAERVARANQARREADANADRLAKEAEANAPRPVPVAQRRTVANDTMVNTLNDKLGGRWNVTESNGGHPRFRDEDTGAYFTLHQYSDSMGATTTGLTNGSGAGEKVYHAIFDMAEELGVYYKPDSTLLTANPIRTGVNMLSYMAKRGESAPHIMIAPSQRGIGTRGSENYLGNKRLTVENANQLAKNMRRLVNAELPTGTNIGARTTNAEIEKMAQVTGTNTNMRIGVKSLKLIRKFIRDGQTFKGE